MTRSLGRWIRRSVIVSTTLALVAAVAPTSPTASAGTGPPWDGNPIRAGLGPTYGETWCAPPAPGSSIANQQGAPLALIPQEAVGCTLAQIQAEAIAAGQPPRMEYSVIGKSAGGRDIYGVVLNALETPEQQRDYDRYLAIRAIELTDPAGAQALLASYGSDVKMPIFIQGNIHGNEEEGADAMMQVLRDLSVTPLTGPGSNPIVTEILNHSVLVVIPMENPDGRFAGTRANGNNFDMNRDWLVQSQSEVRASIAFQHQWMATVGLDMHGYVNPTLIDGLTKPHNPGLEYDIFLDWNQQRLDENEADLAEVGMGITRPVNHYGPSGTPPGNPSTAEGWDDWGPFYTQTYMAYLGVDSSTLEMCSSGAGCDGRFGSKRAQYLGFYSSAKFWLTNRQAMMNDQLETFRRGVADEARLPCCTEPHLVTRGFTEEFHNWMVEYPKAYVIPQNGGGQRSDGEANRMAQWLLDNGIRLERMTADFTWGATTFPAGSYVVWMDQALRGLALTTLSAGQDISDRITQLYAPPAAWSHGYLWGADVVEVPRADPTFTPATTPITAVNPLQGGVRGGIAAPSDFYSVTLRGPSDIRAIQGLLRTGVYGELAEASFTSTTGGPMPAGTVLFNYDPATAPALDAAGAAAGLFFERNVGVVKPATTKLYEVPKVAILVNSANPAPSDTSQSIKVIFGPEARFLSVVTGANSIQNSPTDPLLGFDVIVNTGQNYPTPPNTTAMTRMNAFFARGGGYIATGQSTNNYSFLSTSIPPLVAPPIAQGTQTAYGGIALWNNVGGSGSPVTGGYPAQDTLYLPSNVTYFSSTPVNSTVDGRYLADTESMWVAGLWRARSPDAANAPVIIHGTTTMNSSRYTALAANPFSRQDAEREWTLIGQSALWSNLTDEAGCPGFTQDPRNQVVGTPGNDVLVGTAGDDVICGLGGNDTLTDNEGADFLLGGPGNDTLTSGNGVDRLAPGSGDDGVDGGLGTGPANTGDTVTYFDVFGAGVSVNLSTAGAQNTGPGGTDTIGNVESVTGTRQSGDVLRGNGGVNYLTGGLGDDDLFGLGGNDVLVGSAGNDDLDGGSGIDVASYKSSATGANVNLSATPGTAGDGLGGNDSLIGVEAISGSDLDRDRVTGSANRDFIYGQGGNDILRGEGGNDYIHGGAGTDALDGGLGQDVCIAGEEVTTCEATGTAKPVYPWMYPNAREFFRAVAGSQ